MHSHLLETPAGRFHVIEWGIDPRPQQVELLLHGFNQTAHSWTEYAKQAAADARLVAMTQRGHGSSMRAADGDYGRQTMVDDVIAVADALGLETFTLIGMSMGAVHAITLAAQHPGRVGRLVVVDYAPVVQTVGIDKIKAMVTMRWDSLDDAVRAVRMFNPRRSEENIRSRLRHTMAEQDDGRWGWVVDPAFGLQERFRQGPESMWANVAAVRCPTLLVRGQSSDILSPEMADKMIETLADGRLAVVPGAGHSVSGDNPTGFFEAVRSFTRS
jgi:pimeloyl-ACP methyl ester carboxylesterase